jgi:hypothetical protein
VKSICGDICVCRYNVTQPYLSTQENDECLLLIVIFVTKTLWKHNNLLKEDSQTARPAPSVYVQPAATIWSRCVGVGAPLLGISTQHRFAASVSGPTNTAIGIHCTVNGLAETKH